MPRHWLNWLFRPKLSVPQETSPADNCPPATFVLYDCYMTALAHNVLMMVRRLRRGVGLTGSVVPTDVIAAKVGHAEDDAVADFGTLSRCFAQVIWWAFHLRPALRLVLVDGTLPVAELAPTLPLLVVRALPSFVVNW